MEFSSVDRAPVQLTNTPLSASAVAYYPSKNGEDRLGGVFGCKYVQGRAWADESGTLKLQESHDRSTWTDTSTTTVSASTLAETSDTALTKRYWRWEYTNDGTAQTAFKLLEYRSVTPANVSLAAGTNNIGDVDIEIDGVSPALVNTNQIVTTLKSSGGTEPSITGVPGSSDAVSASAYNGFGVMGFSYEFDGSQWNRKRNNISGTLLASAARTATTNSSTQTNYNAKGVLVTLYISTPTGNAETLQVVVRAHDPVSGGNSNPVAVFTAIAGTAPAGYYRFYVYPGASETIANTNVEVQALPLPRTWSISVNHSAASSWTYSVGYDLIV